MRVEMVPLREAARWPRNPKLHDLEGIKDSLRRHGIVELPARDGASGRLVAGHGRLEALEAMRDAGEPPPARVVAVSGDWAMPVLLGASFPTEAEAEAYLVGSNRLTEKGGWNTEALSAMLERIRSADPDLMKLAGYSDRDLRQLLAQTTKVGGGDDDVPAEVVRRSKVGDLWVLGRHRVACGDARDPAVVQAVLAGSRPTVMVTDPPYGVNYDPKWRRKVGLGSRREKVVLGDSTASWPEVWEHSPADVAYVYHSPMFAHTVHADMERAGFVQRAQIIWRKPMVISRGHYNSNHEPCWYFVRKGKQASWIGPEGGEQTVIDVTTRNETKEDHATQKPVECVTRLARNHDGDLYEPFLGSGTAVIAAERLQRRCFGIDLDPRCVDIALARWELLTGATAVKE